MKKLLKRRLNQKGLTLIELLAVIVILAIIAAIAIPAIGNVIANSRYNAVKSDALNVLNAANLYYAENPSVTEAVKIEDLADDYLDNAGSFEDVSGTVSLETPRAINDATVPADNWNGPGDVKFDAATVEVINNDPNSGSDITEAGVTVGIALDEDEDENN